MVSWVPYSIVFFYNAFVDINLPPLVKTLPAMFAKTSLVWTSMIFTLSNANIRSKINMSLFKKRNRKSFATVSRSKLKYLNV